MNKMAPIDQERPGWLVNFRAEAKGQIATFYKEVINHPVCSRSIGPILFMVAATPPLKGGESSLSLRWYRRSQVCVRPSPEGEGLALKLFPL